MNGYQGLQGITQQITNLLSQITPDLYAKPIELFDGSSIGKHCRHILDFYSCLQKGAQDQAIDYSARIRNSVYETEPQAARKAFLETLETLENIQDQQALQVISDFTAEENTKRAAYPSSFGRECAFIYDHAVHHLAIIKMGLKVLAPELIPGPTFGIAPSTLKHLQSQ